MSVLRVYWYYERILNMVRDIDENRDCCVAGVNERAARVHERGDE